MRITPRMTIISTLALALLACQSGAEEVVEERAGTQYQQFKVVRVVGDLQNPWSVAFLPDESLLVTERPGRLQWVRNGEATELGNVPEVVARGQGGLLDVAVHPDYDENGWIYLTFSHGDGDETATRLVRARLDEEEERLTDVEDIFTQDRYSSSGRHYGSRVLFLDDGTLLMTIGDRGTTPERAQDTQDHAGTVLRLNDDGSVPDDNPFVDDEDFHPEIYSYGHRNIQGIAQHPETGEIWAADHGPRGGDRLDRIEPGENYGWPVVSLGRDYGTQEQWGEGRTADDMVEPIREFLPTLAPSGFAIVTGDHYHRNWDGNFLIGGLAAQQVRRVVLEDDVVVHEEEVLRGTLGRVRDVRIGPDDNIYVVTDESDGGVYRLEPAR